MSTPRDDVLKIFRSAVAAVKPQYLMKLTKIKKQKQKRFLLLSFWLKLIYLIYSEISNMFFVLILI